MSKILTGPKMQIIQFSVLSLAVLAVVMLSIWSFSHHLEETEELLQQQLLVDIAQQRSNYMDARIEGYFDSLYAIAAFFGEDGLDDAEDVEKLREIAGGTQFTCLGIADQTGRMTGIEGIVQTTKDISSQSYWEEMVGGSDMVTGLSLDSHSGKKHFYVAVPLRGADNSFVGAVIGDVELDSFRTRDNVQADMRGYRSYVVDAQGDFILRDAGDAQNWSKHNIFLEIALEDSSFDGGSVQEQMRRRLSVGTEAFVNGADSLLYFSPMELNNWYTVVVLPKAEIQNHIAELVGKDINYLVCRIVAAFLVLVGAILHRMKRVMEREKETLQNQADRDSLTGLLNRRAAEERINGMLERLEYGAMVMLDLDDFKKLNDTLGHQFGDRALREVAEALRTSTRQEDVLCRIGGDEFLLYVPTLTADTLPPLMERLLRRIPQTYEEGDKSVHIGVSIGVSFAPGDASTVRGLYTKADAALYRAKRSGKGRYFTASDCADGKETP